MIPAENILWAAGNQASPVLKTLNVPLDRQGRAMVEADLSIPNHPEIFVLGDAAYAMDKKGKPLPGLAPVAVQQGRYVAQILRKRLPKQERPPFVYFDKGTMATIGKTKAIGTFGKLQFSGFIAWLAWCFVHILYLIGFRNRLVVITQWLFSYFSSQRGARLSTARLMKKCPTCINKRKLQNAQCIVNSGLFNPRFYLLSRFWLAQGVFFSGLLPGIGFGLCYGEPIYFVFDLGQGSFLCWPAPFIVGGFILDLPQEKGAIFLSRPCSPINLLFKKGSSIEGCSTSMEEKYPVPPIISVKIILWPIAITS
jgi:hypothetical protein